MSFQEPLQLNGTKGKFMDIILLPMYLCSHLLPHSSVLKMGMYQVQLKAHPSVSELLIWTTMVSLIVLSSDLHQASPNQILPYPESFPFFHLHILS